MGEKTRASWSGQLAFVVAAAASAIGLGNLWRFPYLAAQYGGGTFILVYLILTVTLGFTLLVTEIAIGRLTRQSQLTAFGRLKKGWGFVGVLGTLVPGLILPYYCVIGGWVLNYLRAYGHMAFTGEALMGEAAADSAAFFSGFISAPFAPLGYGIVFSVLCAAVIVLGVKNGIEKSNLVMMPVLLAMSVAIAVYVLFLPGAGEGFRYYLVPNMDSLTDASGRFSVALLGKTVLGAMGQMFFSLSIAMGIMVTYGSYMKSGDSIERSVRRIEIFDTAVALLAGFMIIPIVYLFAVKTGTPVKEAMNAGPGLMFITLPKVFAMLGPAGNWFGLAFFILVTFAAATSCISIYEACVAAVCDHFRLSRLRATLVVGAVSSALSVLPALGYGTLGDVRVFGQQFLDAFDFVTNSVLMPVVALGTCVFAGWTIRPETILAECTQRGTQPFKAKFLYVVMVKYLAPVLVIAVFVSEICRAFGIGGWKI
ncbi:MAG: sodium-dependent transporter [Kiritimatiellia bacterium]